MKKRVARYAIAIVSLLFIFLITGEHSRTPYIPTHKLDADTLKAAIGIDGGMFANKGFPIGFQYRLLNRYASAQGIILEVLPPYSDYDNWELLHSEDIDIIVADLSDNPIPDSYREKVINSIFITDSTVWITRADDGILLDNINFWLAYYMQKPEYDNLKRQFFRSYRIQPHIENMTQTNIISPYDDIIKANSKILGWDWRLLSAIIHQESRFSMGAQSSRGATGLMQIKESTAKHYGVSDIFNPASNIKAGTLHLRHLQKIYEGEGMDSTNVVKFTLAAYNAGEGRIEDCMNFALSLEKDYRDWEEVCRVIPQMPKFNGRETIRYVDAVLSKYEEYLYVIKP